MNEMPPLNNPIEKFKNTIRMLVGDKNLAPQRYIQLAKQAVNLKEQYPDYREIIAQSMVDAGSKLDSESNLDALKDYFYQLELPDAHMDRSDGLNVDQKWNRIVELCREFEGSER